MQLVTRSLHLIDAELRDDPEANRLFLEILTSRNEPEIVLRRMNEAGVLGRFVPRLRPIVAMMQFNMYHHYTVDEHLIRAHRRARRDRARRASRRASAGERDHAGIKDRARRSTSRCSCTTSPRAASRIIRSPAPRIARRARPAPRPDAGADRDRRLAGRASSADEQHRAVARPHRPQDHRRFRRRGADPGADEAAARSSPSPTSTRSGPACGTAGRGSFCARSTTRPSRC